MTSFLRRAGPFETDDRHTPGLEKGHLLFQPYSVNLQLLKFSLQDIKAALKQDPSSMKDQNYVYCLLECETDEGQPMFPMASYRQEVFADAQGAARAVHEFWGIEDLEERAKDQEVRMHGVVCLFVITVLSEEWLCIMTEQCCRTLDA